MPPYNEPNDKIRTCSSSHDMMLSKVMIPGTSESLGYPPCKGMTKVLYTYGEGEHNNLGSGKIFWIGLSFYTSHFKDIVKTR